jgi:metal-responsive CopG/Arc/MetJ family transcriptional regulator
MLDYQCQRWYHTSMDKTTIYLPADLKSAIKRAARRRGVSEAEVVRDSIRTAIGGERPHPRGGLFASGAPIARQEEEHLTGFGER